MTVTPIDPTVGMHAAAAEIVERLGLAPHPEGGFYRETFRDSRRVSGRASSTAIYFLLARGQISHWHKVDAAECWHFYAGAPLVLDTWTPGHPITSRTLGLALASGERPQIVVEADHWQRARSTGDWTLTGCTVAPGFDFSGFVMAAEGFDPSLA